MFGGGSLFGGVGGGLGGGFPPRQVFEEQYHCYSVAYADKAHLEVRVLCDSTKDGAEGDASGAPSFVSTMHDCFVSILSLKPSLSHYLTLLHVPFQFLGLPLVLSLP